MNMQLYNNIILFTLATATTLTGVFLLGSRIPKLYRSEIYIARITLAAANLMLGIPAFFLYMFPQIPKVMVFLSFFFDTAAYQLIVVSCLILSTRPDKPMPKKWYAYLSSASGVSSIAGYAYYSGWTESMAVYTAALVLCILSSIGQIRIFYSNHFDRKLAPGGKFLAVLFYASVFMALFSAFGMTNKHIAESVYLDFFIIAYTIINICYAIAFINYVYKLKSLLRNSGKDNTADIGILEDHLRNALKNYEENFGFLKQDEGMEFVAKELGTNLDFLRYYFRKNMSSDFRTWRISLRIKFAQKMLLNDPSVSMNTIANKSGFSSKSNFYHYFKKITGETPTEFKERHR